jgi:CO/xanthine dehydrogenase Mo-binding subunit
MLRQSMYTSLTIPTKELNQVGARGIGETGLAEVAAAIADAV